MTANDLGFASATPANMANAARVHAIEWGKGIAERTLVAFGGAAPLHAARLAEKLGLDANAVAQTHLGIEHDLSINNVFNLAAL